MPYVRLLGLFFLNCQHNLVYLSLFLGVYFIIF